MLVKILIFYYKLLLSSMDPNIDKRYRIYYAVKWIHFYIRVATLFKYKEAYNFLCNASLIIFHCLILNYAWLYLLNRCRLKISFFTNCWYFQLEQKFSKMYSNLKNLREQHPIVIIIYITQLYLYYMFFYLNCNLFSS